LVITHFSARYANQYTLLKEARNDFFPTWVATEYRPIFTDPAHEKGIINARAYIKEINHKKKRRNSSKKKKKSKKKRFRKRKKDRNKKSSSNKNKSNKSGNSGSGSNNSSESHDNEKQPKHITPRTPFDDFDRF